MLSGGPPWLAKNQYAIDAKVSPEDIVAWQRSDPDQKMLRSALQQMLKERCKLVLHRTATEQSVYALVIRRGAKLKLQEGATDEPIPRGAIRINNDGGFKHLDKGSVGFYSISMKYLTGFLSTFGIDQTVIDATGLKGRYDFVLPRRVDEGGEQGVTLGLPWDLESLGLILKPVKAAIETLVVDHVEEPSSN